MGEEKGISVSAFLPSSLPRSLSSLTAASGKLACTVNLKSSHSSMRKEERGSERDTTKTINDNYSHAAHNLFLSHDMLPRKQE